MIHQSKVLPVMELKTSETYQKGMNCSKILVVIEQSKNNCVDTSLNSSSESIYMKQTNEHSPISN